MQPIQKHAPHRITKIQKCKLQIVHTTSATLISSVLRVCIFSLLLFGALAAASLTLDFFSCFFIMPFSLFDSFLLGFSDFLTNLLFLLSREGLGVVVLVLVLKFPFKLDPRLLF
ncbi:hypothetical protein V8G54_007405 [Vigna mungo]|uniref:Transmembrane protein n=1 Tax=Vigna mungo TaxID=3915 RepID=A0AAQ3P291_VIGMU